MAWGVTSTGFVRPSLDEIKTDLEDACKSVFGESIDVTPQSNFGQLIGVMAERYSDLWEQGEAVYNAYSPDSATGVSLDNLAAITGTIREPATRSTSDSHFLFGNNGTVVPAGSIVVVETTGVRFRTIANETLATATAWASSTAVVVGAIRRNGATQRCYRCITAGTTASSGGPTTTDASITDGTAVWRYMGDGAAYALCDIESEDTGPKVGAAYTINQIGTPVAGWLGTRNSHDAVLGSDVETDASLRARREDELRANGSGTVESIRADVLAVEDVTSCTVYENTTDAVVDSIDPHTFETVVLGGVDADIAQAIFDTKPAGIGTTGSTSVTVADTQGFNHTVKFTRPTEVAIYVVYNLTYDANLLPADAATQIKDSLIAWGDAQKVGKDAVAAAILARAFMITGILDGTAYIGTAPAPGTSVTVAISNRQLATYDTGRVTVNLTPATP